MSGRDTVRRLAEDFAALERPHALRGSWSSLVFSTHPDRWAAEREADRYLHRPRVEAA
jgi:hypothetical protein